MKTEQFVKYLYQNTIEESGIIYRDIFENTDIKEVKDPYWKDALKLYSGINDEGKEILHKIVQQVQVDTVSNVLGVFDGVVSISEEDIEIEITLKGDNEKLNGDLQDLFLELDEENRVC